MNNEMRLLSDKITTILNNRGWTVMDLSKKAPDIPYDTLKNIIYHKSEDIKSFKTLKYLATALNVTTDFLLDMKTYPEDEMTLLKNYRKASSHGKQFILAMSGFEARYTDFEDKQIDIKEIPCYDVEVETKNKEILYYIPCLEPTGLFKDGVLYDTSIKTRVKTHLQNVYMAVKIPNDSLNDTYYKNDIILVEKRHPNVGEIAIFHKGNRIYFRKYGRDETNGKHILYSLNINNEDIILTNREKEQYRVLGTCIYIDRKKEH